MFGLFKQKKPHLNRFFHWQRMLRDSEILFEFSHFDSEFDHSVQNVLRIRPAFTQPKTQFFFFHGMDGDAGDAAAVYDLVKIAKAEIIAIGGRGPSWVSDAFVADAEQMIRHFSGEQSEFFLIGISMGASQVLSLAALLPDDLKNRITAVFSLMPGTDFAAMEKKSIFPRLRKTLLDSVKGNAESLKEKSPVCLIDRYRHGLPFVIYFQREDQFMLAQEVKFYIQQLKQKDFRVHLFEDAGAHEFVFSDFNYQKIYDAVQHQKKVSL